MTFKLPLVILTEFLMRLDRKVLGDETSISLGIISDSPRGGCGQGCGCPTFSFTQKRRRRRQGWAHSRWYLQRSLLKVQTSMSMGFSLLTALALVTVACKVKFDRVKR